MARVNNDNNNDDPALVELDGEYEHEGQIFGPGKVRIENPRARRSILRAQEINQRAATS